MSKSSSQVFAAEYQQLAALVQKRIQVEWHCHGLSDTTGIGLGDLLDYADHFGRMLNVVYKFSLLDALREHAQWYATVLAGRGSGDLAFAVLLESWIVAIQGMIKPPECDELSAPLQDLHQDMPAIVEQARNLLHSVRVEPSSPLVASLIAGDVQQARRTVLGPISKGGQPDRVITDLILPAMAEIGLRWELHTLEVYQEHLATEAVKTLLIGLAAMKKPTDSPRRTALVSCVPGDKHDLVPLALWAYLEVRGWSAKNLGTSLLAEQIARAAVDLAPDAIFLVQTMLSQLDDALETIALVRARLPDRRIVIGGRGAEAGRAILQQAGAIVARNFEEACQLLGGGG